MAIDYYKILGISSTATTADIKKVYRRLAKKYHPDVSKEQNAEEKFKEIQVAYDVLSNPEKRQLYDQFGEQWQQAKQAKERGFDPGAGVDPTSGAYTGGFEGFTARDGAHFYTTGSGRVEDVFADFFNATHEARARQTHEAKGQDVHSKIAVDLLEAYQGITKTITLAMPDGPKSLRVKIPAGVIDGQQIRLSGQGQSGGEPGDLYLQIELKPHVFFKPMGADIYVTLPISPWEAALGTTVSVPTLGGVVSLKIVANSLSGQKLRLKNRGLPAKPPGDQYCILTIVTPPANNQESKHFYATMAKQFAAFDPRVSLNH